MLSTRGKLWLVAYFSGLRAKARTLKLDKELLDEIDKVIDIIKGLPTDDNASRSERDTDSSGEDQKGVPPTS